MHPVAKQLMTAEKLAILREEYRRMKYNGKAGGLNHTPFDEYAEQRLFNEHFGGVTIKAPEHKGE